MEVKLKRTEPMQVATISHVGPYGEVGKLYEEIVKWLNQKQLQIAGPPFGWFHDNPEEVPAHKLRCEVGFPFKCKAKPEGNIKIKRIPAQEVLYTIHKGTYMEVGSTYAALFQHAMEKGVHAARASNGDLSQRPTPSCGKRTPHRSTTTSKERDERTLITRQHV